MTMIVCVWDLPLRCFHWLLVVCILFAYVSAQLGGLWLDWHARFGTILFALLVFRFTWGFMGSTYSRFTSFMPTPGRIIKTALQTGGMDVGHNPLGALSIYAMLLLILTQSCTELFAMNDEIEFYGPLYDLISLNWSERMTALHTQLFDVLAVLIGLHLLAIIYYAIVKHKNLVAQMITGTAHVAEDIDVPPIHGGNKTQLLTAVSLSILAYWLVQGGVFQLGSVLTRFGLVR